MSELFTPEFCALLDALKEYDKKITRQTEDIYDILLNKGIITKDDIYKDTLETMNNKKVIRTKLKEMYNKFVEERGENNG